MPRPTQKDIAARLGLSPSLVSRVLSGRAADIGASPRTVARIEQTARTLGYIPNAAARRLKGTGGPALGVVAADLQDPFFGALVAALLRAGHRAGYALTLTGFDRRQAAPRDLSLLLEQPLDGLVVLGGGAAPWLAPFARRGLPLARIGNGPRLTGVHEAAPDERAGFAALLDHLLARGHRRLAVLAADSSVHRHRAALIRRLATARGLRIPAARIIVAAPEVMDAGTAAADTFLHTPGPAPTAVLCTSDAVAIGALRRFQEAGHRIPDDLALTGFDDLPFARLVTPPLTTLRQPIDTLVAHALACLAPPSRPAARTLFPLTLIERASTDAPAAVPPAPLRRTRP